MNAGVFIAAEARGREEILTLKRVSKFSRCVATESSLITLSCELLQAGVIHDDQRSGAQTARRTSQAHSAPTQRQTITPEHDAPLENRGHQWQSTVLFTRWRNLVLIRKSDR